MRPMRVIIAIIIGCILASGSCLAHQDVLIAVKDDGRLEGIPSEYGPATLRVNFASPEAGDPPITSITLNLGKNQVRLPICVTGLLETRRLSEVKASASWYHDEEILPYYLHIDFFDPGYSGSRWANPGYSLLFNLHTGKLMEMKVTIVRDSGKRMQNVPIDLAARCKSAELRGFASNVR